MISNVPESRRLKNGLYELEIVCFQDSPFLFFVVFSWLAQIPFDGVIHWQERSRVPQTRNPSSSRINEAVCLTIRSTASQVSRQSFVKSPSQNELVLELTGHFVYSIFSFVFVRTSQMPEAQRGGGSGKEVFTRSFSSLSDHHGHQRGQDLLLFSARRHAAMWFAQRFIR